MKKFFAIAAIAVSIVACNNSGKSSDEEKRVADSIEAKRVADSIANAQMPLPTPEEIEAKRIADSTRVADSLKNIK